MNEILKKIFEGNVDVLHGNGATEDSIRAAECDLNCRFSDDYRAYLQLYGIAAINGHELTGVSKSDRVNVVAVTREELKINANIPENFYVVERTYIDGIIIWQATSGEVYKTLPGVEPILICNSFCDFVRNM